MEPTSNPYAASYQQQPPKPTADADGLAIAALICAFFIPILGIIFGHMSRSQASRHGQKPSGVATAGCVLGWVFTIAGILLAVILVVALATASSSIPQ